MTLNSIWETIKNNPGWITMIIILILSFVEVSKIKINPWSAIGRAIGKFLGVKEVNDKVDAVDKKVENSDRKLKELEHKIDENQATTIRVRILRFEDDLQGGKLCSKDSWDQCMDDIRRYEEYTASHPDFKNEITVASINHIRRGYAERLEKKDWVR